MIKEYKLISAFVNLDCGLGDEKICNIDLRINDEEIFSKIKGIVDADGVYYEDGWMIETVVNEDANIVTGLHELFYIGDNGRQSILLIEEHSENKEFINKVDGFLIKELDYEEFLKINKAN